MAIFDHFKKTSAHADGVCARALNVRVIMDVLNPIKAYAQTYSGEVLLHFLLKCYIPRSICYIGRSIVSTSLVGCQTLSGDLRRDIFVIFLQRAKFIKRCGAADSLQSVILCDRSPDPTCRGKRYIELESDGSSDLYKDSGFPCGRLY